jgi:RNA polymerase-binding transcription factor DksA
MITGMTNRSNASPSPFSTAELAHWRELLRARRRALGADLDALADDAMEGEKVSISSNHLAEGASDAQEQDLSVIAADSEKQLVWQIDRALRKIETNQPLPFGICEHTREPIPRERLALMPWTPFSAQAAEHAERNGLTPDDLLVDD